MNNEYTWLNCNDDDVIRLEKDSFQIIRLKELIKTEISNKFTHNIYTTQSPNYGITIHGLFSKIAFSLENIVIDDIQIHSIKACKILRTDGKGWQKGNLKILVNKSNFDNNFTVDLEFSVDKSNEIESPLDDIRKIMNTSIS